MNTNKQKFNLFKDNNKDSLGLMKHLKAPILGIAVCICCASFATSAWFNETISSSSTAMTGARFAAVLTHEGSSASEILAGEAGIQAFTVAQGEDDYVLVIEAADDSNGIGYCRIATPDDRVYYTDMIGPGGSDTVKIEAYMNGSVKVTPILGIRETQDESMSVIETQTIIIGNKELYLAELEAEQARIAAEKAAQEAAKAAEEAEKARLEAELAASNAETSAESFIEEGGNYDPDEWEASVTEGADKSADTTADSTEESGEVSDTTADSTEETGEVSDTTADSTEESDEVSDTTADSTEESSEVSDTTVDSTEESGEVSDTTADSTEESGEVSDTTADSAEESGEVSDTTADS
ncbi:MAG: hypothetical protein IJ391_08385, partial [Clostridia bacterium]|nr:hypothetical protein [Clostridia bacterium]